jgi:gas vesicle protein
MVNEWKVCSLVFDLISFFAGVAAGCLTGALAGVLYGFERTGQLQENMLELRKKVDSIDASADSTTGPQDAASKARIRELQAEIESIHEEIRRMYRKTAH